MPKSKRQASVAPPVAYQGIAPRLGDPRVALVAAVVEMVRVAVPVAAPAMLTGLVEPKLRVGAYCALAGLEVTAAVSVTLPVKPPEGVTVMLEVFPVVAPAATVTAVPVTVPAGVALFTVRVTLAVAVVYFVESVGVKVTVSVCGTAFNTAPADGE
jgi:hypothetical protein